MARDARRAAITGHYAASVSKVMDALRGAVSNLDEINRVSRQADEKVQGIELEIQKMLDLKLGVPGS